MLYLANPSTAAARRAMAAGLLAAIMSPRQGNRLPAGTLFAIDNNCGPSRNGMPGTGYPGDERCLGLVQRLVDADGADPRDPGTSRCLPAAAPDVVGNASATLRRFYMPARIRHAGIPAALVAQDGLEDLTVPWDDLDAHGIPEILAELSLGHEVTGMRGLYSHVSAHMRQELKDKPQARWQESLQQRFEPNSGSPVRALDELLTPLRTKMGTARSSVPKFAPLAIPAPPG